jgi:glycerol kinase
MDLGSGSWDDEILEILGVPAGLLPEIRDNDARFGVTRGTGAIPDGIPIASVVGDQQAALFGQACLTQGEAKCTYGTGAFLVANTGAKILRSRHGLLSTAAWRRRGRTCYAVEGSTFVAGAAVQWLRDGLGLIRSSAEVEALARRVRDTGGVMFVPAFAGLGSPWWNPDARGLVCGLTRGSTAAHLARAALEGIAFQIGDLVASVEKDLGKKLRLLKVDGGAAANDLLLQLQADLLGADVMRPRSTSSTTAIGAGALAGLTIGLFRSEDDIRRAWKPDRRFVPQIAPRERARRIAEWEMAVRRVML